VKTHPVPKPKQNETRRRWIMANKDKVFDSIRNMIVLETQAKHFLRVLEAGSVSTNVYLRRIRNFALDMNWLPWHVLPKKRWPAVTFKEKRAITWPEHQAVVLREGNAERKTFYQPAWHLGASQTDLANLEAENVDWDQRVISLARKKTGRIATLRFDEETAEILRSLPVNGPLFPYLRSVRAVTERRSLSNDVEDLASTESHCTRTGRVGGAGEEGWLSRMVRARGFGPQQ